MAAVFGFPTLVNEKAARSVAAGVVAMAIVALVTGSPWVASVMAVGFALRVASGPRFSPLGRLAAHVVAPRLGPAVMVPGPPKRFAQSVGLAFTSGAAVAGFAGAQSVSAALLAVLLLFAALEAFAGFCAGCFVFSRLMAWGLIPEKTCQACADITRKGDRAAYVDVA